jgi:hypothetical protein
MKCDYCGNSAALVGGDVIYPHRPDLHDKRFYNCAACRAYVGCHPGTDKPLGRLANAELRNAKQKAHAAFDPVWQSRRISRKAAYKQLARRLGIDANDCHIGMFDIARCMHVVLLYGDAA